MNLRDGARACGCCTAFAAMLLPLAAVAAPLEMTVGPDKPGELQQALDKLKDTPHPDGAVIRLAPGIYRLPAPLRLGAAQSGTPGHPVVLQGPANGHAVLSGARPVSGFAPVKDDAALARLPQAARGHVLQADLRSQGLADFGAFVRQGQTLPLKPSPMEVFYKGQPAVLARWPNEGYTAITALRDGAQGNAFGVAGGHVKSWANEPALQAVGYWFYDWADESVEIARVDGDGTLEIKGGKPAYGMKQGQRVFVQNALSELDAPGEYYIDRDAGTLFFWPAAPLAPDDVEVSMLDYGVLVHNASDVELRDVDVEDVRADAIVVDGGSGVTVAGARIRNTGQRGVVASGAGHRVVDCDLSETGQGGISLSGGDRKTLSPGRLAADGNRIRNYSRLVRAYRPAVSVAGVGNRARGNVIAHAPHNAIVFYGNDHRIEFNDISDVARETGDVGAIYADRDWSARGTVISNNYLHDIHAPGAFGAHAIYLDDQTSGITVFGNLVVRVDQGVFVGGGRDNLIENNLFVRDGSAIKIDARGLGWQKALTADPKGELRSRLAAVPYDQPVYARRYPGLANILKENTGRPQGNRASDNIVLDGPPMEVLDKADYGIEVKDMFTEREAPLVAGRGAAGSKAPRDFELAPGSQAQQRGFRPLPLGTMDCFSARWAGQDAHPQRACPVAGDDAH